MAFTNYIQQITATNGTTHDLVDTSASHYVKGTQTASTNVWTGALPDGVTAYYDGLSIDYFLPYAGTSTAATLNLGGKGAKPVYVGNGTGGVTTHYPANSVIHLTYIINSNLNSGNGCWKADAYYNTNTTYSAGTGISLNGTTFSANLGFTTSGNNRAVLADSNGKLYVTQKDDNTDTKVTSSANHYTPSTASGNDKTASASGATAAWSIDVVKGITINTDGKGHITGLSVTSGKIPANPNSDTKMKFTSTTENGGYPIALGPNVITSGTAYEGYYNTNLMYNPSFKELSNGTAKLTSASSTTANTAAYDKITLGNAVAVSSTSAHSQGQIILYGSTAYAHTIQGAPTAARTITLPDKGGTVALTSDIVANTDTTYALSGALSSHKFTSTLTAGGSGSGTSTSDFTLAAGTGITITDDTTNRKMTIACSVTDTDTKVTQAYSTSSSSYPLLMTATAGTSSTASRGATTAILNNGLYYTPSSQKLTVGSSVKISGWTWDGVSVINHLSLRYDA